MEPGKISAETAQHLITQAAANGLSVDDYLKYLPGLENTALPESDPDEFLADLELLAEGTEHIPSSDLTWSRKDIYFDHD